MYEFPASPAIGDVANGYRFDGTGWGGGPAVPTPTEQFFDLSGLTTKDIAVPAWAKAVQIIGTYFTTTNFGIACQVSVDGTTFIAGTTNYAYGGSILNSGTAAQSQLVTTDTTGLQVSFSGDNSMTSMPNLATTEINLVKPNAGTALFTAKSYSKSYDSTVSLGYRSGFIHGYVKNVAVGSALAIKALRLILGGAGAFGPGSNVLVKWLGDQVPQANGIVNEPPQDGNEYTRVNGVWRLKSQSYILDGLINFDFGVPAGARAVRVYASLMPPNPVQAGSVLLKASLDGTTFLAGASDYHYAGFIYYSGTSATAANLGSVVSANCYLAFNNDSNIVQEVIDLRMSMVRPTVPSNQPWYGMVNSVSYQSASANFYNAAQVRVGVMNTNAGAVTVLKALRIHRASGAFGSPSYANVEWLY